MERKNSRIISCDFGFVYRDKLIHSTGSDPSNKYGCEECGKTGIECPIGSLNDDAVEGISNIARYSCDTEYFKTLE